MVQPATVSFSGPALSYLLFESSQESVRQVCLHVVNK